MPTNSFIRVYNAKPGIDRKEKISPEHAAAKSKQKNRFSLTFKKIC